MHRCTDYPIGVFPRRLLLNLSKSMARGYPVSSNMFNSKYPGLTRNYFWFFRMMYQGMVAIPTRWKMDIPFCFDVHPQGKTIGLDLGTPNTGHRGSRTQNRSELLVGRLHS